MREIIATGKTVEEATESACAQLGLERDEVSVEILEMPAKKIFKTMPAKVRVVENADEAPHAHKAAPEPAPKAARAAPEKREAAKEDVPVGTHTPHSDEPEIDIALDAAPRVQAAVTYLENVFHAMGASDVRITAKKQGEATLLKVEGESPAQVIDIKGEVIQALSYLVDRGVNAGVDKKNPEFLRIRLDIAGYRNRRESELIELAKRLGEEVARTGRSKTLAPMNPYERLIVHTAIGAIEGISSESKGSDMERRVVIRSLAPNATEGEDWRAPRPAGGRGDRGGRDRERSGNRSPREGRDRGPRADRGGYRGGSGGPPRGPRPSAPAREFADRPQDTAGGPVVPQRREAIKDGDDLPLYGKIEL